MKKEAKYIGDGVYVEQGAWAGQIRLFTSDGINETNEIFLEPSEMNALVACIKENGWMSPARPPQ
jgi:hypothetical protein